MNSKIINYLAFQRLSNHLTDLDGLRGIAVLLVLFRHAATAFSSNDQHLIPIAGWDAGIFMINGWVGVDLFFVLSGFLITSHIIRTREKNGNVWCWSTYLTKRALRIIPAYFAVLFLAVFSLIPFYEISPNLIELRTTYHLLFLQDYFPSNIVVSFWSLGVEEKFYLIAPFLVIFLFKLRSLQHRVWAIILLFLTCLTMRIFTDIQNPGFDEYVPFFLKFRSPFHLAMDPILIGVLLALIYRAKEKIPHLTSPRVAKVSFWLGVSIFLTLTTTTDLMGEITWWDKTLQPSLLAFACGCITFGLLFGGGVSPLFRSFTLFFFARISYSLYLIHLPLVPLALVLSNYIDPTGGDFFIFCLIFFSISILAALLLHYVVEKPFLIMKDKIKFSPVRQAPHHSIPSRK